MLKRVLITAANVHDGLGGVHLRGQRPVLPAEIADIFIAKNMAVLDADGLTQSEAKAIADAEDDKRHQAEQKARAEAAMRQHDNLPLEERIAELDRRAELPDEPIVVPTKRKRQKG